MAWVKLTHNENSFYTYATGGHCLTAHGSLGVPSGFGKKTFLKRHIFGFKVDFLYFFATNLSASKNTKK